MSADINLAMLLKRSLEDPEAAVAEGHSLTKQNRASRQLRAVADRVRRAQVDVDKHRHTSAPTAERELQRALAAWFEVSTVALGMGEP